MLVVQERRRFYRESMTAYLRRQLTTEVAEGVVDRVSLLDAAARGPLTYAVIEADNVPWEVGELVQSMQRQRPGIQLIGLTTSARAGLMDGVVLVPRSASPEQVVELVEPSRAPSRPLSSVSPEAMAMAPDRSAAAGPGPAQPRPDRGRGRGAPRPFRTCRGQVEDGYIHQARRPEPGPGGRHRSRHRGYSAQPASWEGPPPG